MPNEALHQNKPPKQVSPQISLLSNLYPLIGACAVLMTSSAIQHCIRGSLAFIFSKSGIHPKDLKVFKSLMFCNYAPGILFSLFTGQLTDMFGDFTSLMFFTTISTLGAWFLFYCISLKATVHFYFIAMFFYGTGQIMLRIPMKRMIANFYDGPHLALALNIVHNSSHLMGILGGVSMSYLLYNYRIAHTFLIMSLFASIAIPCGIFLKGKVEKNKPKKVKLKATIFEFFATTDALFYLIMVGGCCVDGVSVSYKNVETYIFERHAKNATAQEIMQGIAVAKIFNLFGPIISMGIDKFPFRTVYMLISGIVVCLIYLIFNIFVYFDMKVSKNILIAISISYKINLVLFYSSWYPSLAILLKKKLRGTGFGVVSTLDNLGYVILLLGFSMLGKYGMFVFLMVAVTGTLLFLVALIKSMGDNDRINKKL